jgi:hypothetical protein
MQLPTIHNSKSVLVACAAATVVWVSAGSLTPPAGPVSPTMKDLDDVEPRTAIRNDFDTITPIVISQPGSYYLAEDIYAIHSQHGIQITVSHVTLDLNGFTIYGNTEVGSLDGIHIDDERHYVTIKNGTVRDFFGKGIGGSSSDGCIVEGVRVINNGSHGIDLRDYSLVRDTMALNSLQGDGVRVSGKAVISGCVAWSNGNDLNDAGIRAGADSATVVACTSTDNAGNGIRVGSGSTISACLARNNAGNGLDASSVGHVVDSTATGNAINISATSVHNSYGP